MKKFIFGCVAVIIMVLAALIHADNIPQRGVNRRVEFLSATGNGSDSLPYVLAMQLSYPIDNTSNSVVTMTYPHHELHDGNTFEVGVYDNDLDDGDTINIAFTTLDTTRWVHMVAIMGNTSSSVAEVLEAPTLVLGSGSDVTVFNKKRTSSKVAVVQTVESTPTVGSASSNVSYVSGGAIINGGGELIGLNRDRGVGVSRSIVEEILKPATTYLFRIRALADNGAANVKLIFYQHIDRQ